MIKEFDCELYRQRDKIKDERLLEAIRISRNKRNWKDTGIGGSIGYGHITSSTLKLNAESSKNYGNLDRWFDSCCQSEHLWRARIESTEYGVCRICQVEFSYVRFGAVDQIKIGNKFGDIGFEIDINKPRDICTQCQECLEKEYTKLTIPEGKCIGQHGGRRKKEIIEKYRDLLDSLVITKKIKSYGKQRQKED